MNLTEDIKALSSYLTEHIKRFGDYWLDMNIWPKALDEMMTNNVRTIDNIINRKIGGWLKL